MAVILQTDRLRLREMELSDVDDLYALDSDPEVMRYIGDGSTSTREQLDVAIVRVRNYYRQHEGLGIWLAERTLPDGQFEFIGWGCLKHLDKTDQIEVGYRLMKHAWGNGYATEAARALVAYGFEQLGLERIVAVTNPKNLASQRVLEKCGLVRTGTETYYGSECTFFEMTNPSKST